MKGVNETIEHMERILNSLNYLISSIQKNANELGFKDQNIFWVAEEGSKFIRNSFRKIYQNFSISLTKEIEQRDKNYFEESIILDSNCISAKKPFFSSEATRKFYLIVQSGKFNLKKLLRRKIGIS